MLHSFSTSDRLFDISFFFFPRDSDCGDDEMSELVKEEKRRKKMEAVADDLFNNEKVSLILFPYPQEREREIWSIHNLIAYLP